MDALEFLHEGVPQKEPEPKEPPVFRGEKPQPKEPDAHTFLRMEQDPDLPETHVLENNPNIAGGVGVASEVAKAFIPYTKYLDEEERNDFMAKDKQHQVRDLLWQVLATESLLFFSSKGAKHIGDKIAKSLEEKFPNAYEFLTRQRTIKRVKTPAQKEVRELVLERGANIGTKQLESKRFVRDIENAHTTQELEAVPFIRQGMKDPETLNKIGRGDLVDIVKNPSPELRKTVSKIGDYYDESHQFLKDNWGDVDFVKNYVTQIWDIPKNKTAEVVNFFATRNPFLKKRIIPTLEEGIELGLKPKTTNIADLLRIYDQFKIKTAFNFKFAEGLKQMVDESGQPLMLRADKAPVDWVEINHPALNRAMAVGKTSTDIPMLMKVPVKVHPEIAPQVNVIFENPFSHKAITALQTVNAFTKKGMLTLSLFHHQALTESAFSSGIGMKALSLWNPVKVYRALKYGDFAWLAEGSAAADGITHGLTIGALDDVQRSVIQNSLIAAENATKNVPLVKHLTKGVRKANDLWDEALWDYYHNTLKVWAYEENVYQSLRGKTLTAEQITAVKREMATFVNDSFGGQNWDLQPILGNPKVKQMLHLGILSPDWTISTLKQAAAPMVGVAKGGVAGKALAKRGALFWTKAAIYFNVIAQAANYHNTKKDYGEGRFTWDNPPDHKLNIYWGKNPDGTERYLRMGKQFREVMEWGEDPPEKLGGKTSPIVGEVVRQATGHNIGSGYPTEFAEGDFWNPRNLKERMKSIAMMPVPFSLRPYITERPKNFMFTFPTSKGMTNYKAIQEFKKVIKKGDIEGIKEIYVHSLRNNLDAESLYKSAKNSVKADITFDDKKMAMEIYKGLVGLDDLARADALMKYKTDGILTLGIAKQLDALYKKEKNIKAQKVLLGIK